MLRLISTADLAALAEMRAAMADAMRANAGAILCTTLRAGGPVPGPGADDDRRKHARIAALLPRLAAGQHRTGRR